MFVLKSSYSVCEQRKGLSGTGRGCPGSPCVWLDVALSAIVWLTVVLVHRLESVSEVFPILNDSVIL